MAVTQDQIKVYEFFFNMGMRLLLTCAGIYAFFLVLHALLDAKTPGDKGTYAFMETLIAGTTFWPYRFYFSFGNKESTTASSTPQIVPAQVPSAPSSSDTQA